jgi:hypothetical protein
MPIIANTTSSNTFSAIRAQLNSVTKRMNAFAGNESAFYANTLTANVRFVSSGSTRLGTTGSNRTIINGLLSANGNLSVSGNTTIGGAGKVANATGWFGVTGRQSISTNLFVGGNTAIIGSVGVGLSSPLNSKLNVGSAALTSFTGTTAGTMTLFDTSSTTDRFTTLDFTTSNQSLPVARIGMKFTGGGSQFHFGTSTSYVSGVNVTAMTLDQSGNLTATGNVTAYSDEKLKTDIKTIENALALVEQMRGVRYNRIEDGKAGIGVVAQEMQQVLPEVVLEGDNLSVAYGNLVGVLIEAVKELSARVKELEAK